jgi:hypothetical protein
MADNQSSVETNMEHVQEFGIVVGIGREVGTCVIENDRINHCIDLWNSTLIEIKEHMKKYDWSPNSMTYHCPRPSSNSKVNFYCKWLYDQNADYRSHHPVKCVNFMQIPLLHSIWGTFILDPEFSKYTKDTINQTEWLLVLVENVRLLEEYAENQNQSKKDKKKKITKITSRTKIKSYKDLYLWYNKYETLINSALEPKHALGIMKSSRMFYEWNIRVRPYSYLF